LPRWWLWLFYATIVWAFAYWVFYPAWPTVGGYTTGVLGYTNRTQVAADLADLQKARGDKGAALLQTPLADIERDPMLLAFAQAQGRAAFGNNCAPCHGVGATGGIGYPNLNDDWLWGGTLAAIPETIAYGVRSGNDKARQSAMPAFGKNGILKPDEIVAVASHVRSLSGLARVQASTSPKARRFSRIAAPVATVRTPKATRTLALPIWPTASGSTARTRLPSSTPLLMATQA